MNYFNFWYFLRHLESSPKFRYKRSDWWNSRWGCAWLLKTIFWLLGVLNLIIVIGYVLHRRDILVSRKYSVSHPVCIMKKNFQRLAEKKFPQRHSLKYRTGALPFQMQDTISSISKYLLFSAKIIYTRAYTKWHKTK